MLVPIIIWIMKKDVPIISAIARQAVILNVAVFLAFGAAAVLLLTVILIPAVFLFWCLLAIAAARAARSSARSKRTTGFTTGIRWWGLTRNSGTTGNVR